MSRRGRGLENDRLETVADDGDEGCRVGFHVHGREPGAKPVHQRVDCRPAGRHVDRGQHGHDVRPGGDLLVERGDATVHNTESGDDVGLRRSAG